MPMLHEMTERALDRWDRVRRYYFKGVLVRRVEQAQAEHHGCSRSTRAARPRPALEDTIRARTIQSALALAYTRPHLERTRGWLVAHDRS